MVDPSTSTGTGSMPQNVQVARKRGPKGGKKRKTNRRLSSVKGTGGSNKKQQKESNTSDTAVVVVAQPTKNYDELSSSDISEYDNMATTTVATLPEATNLDESDSEIEYEEEDAVFENIHGLDEFVEERNEPIFKSDTVQRLAIGYMFYKKFGAPENHQEWRDKKIRPQIRKAFDLDDGTRIDHILNDVVACKKAGISYTGTHNIGASMRKCPLLALDSIEAQIVANCLESGFSLPLTQWSVNQHLRETHKLSLTQSPIRHLMKRMKPLVK
jgi:hypothetical protein